jgi:O-antigen ligase
VAVGGFNVILESMAQADFFSGVLPFLISYVLFYFTMKQLPLFDENNEKVAGIVSIAAAFYVARFITVNAVYQQFFVQYFGTLTLGIIGILGLLMLLAMMGWDWSDFDSTGKSVVGGIMGLIAIAAFTVSGGLSAFIPSGTGSGIWTAVLNAVAIGLETGLVWIILVIGVVAWVVASSDNGTTTTN